LDIPRDLAREGDEEIAAAIVAMKVQEAMRDHAALQDS